MSGGLRGFRFGGGGDGSGGQGGEGGQGALPLPGQLHRGGEPGWRSSRVATAVERGAGKQLGAFKPSFGSFSAKKIPLGNIGSLCCLK